MFISLSLLLAVRVHTQWYHSIQRLKADLFTRRVQKTNLSHSTEHFQTPPPFSMYSCTLSSAILFYRHILAP